MSFVAKNKLKRRERFLELKSTLKCNRCGENDIACLDFHHTDKDDKDFSISAVVKDYSWDRILEEIEKCEVLCANCHRKEHFYAGRNGSR